MRRRARSCRAESGRAQALEELKRTAELVAELGVDRLVCPCGTTEKFTTDDYARGVDNLREAGEIVKPLGVTAMLEFMRGSTFIGTLPTSLQDDAPGRAPQRPADARLLSLLGGPQ